MQTTRAARTLGLLLGLAVAGCAAAAARGFEPVGESPLAPQLEIVVLTRSLLAIDALGGGQREERLERGEQVLWYATQGRVGVALTDRRILAVATRSGFWQETRYRDGELPPPEAILGDRVALVVTPLRVLGFDGGSRNLIEQRLGPREQVLGRAVGENVVVVVTDRRALGLSPFRGGFFETRVRLVERIENVSAQANHVTVTTSKRLLIFRAPSASWEERRLHLH